MGLADGIRTTYGQAAKEVRKKLDDFFAAYRQKAEQKLKQLQEGVISDEEYRRWMQSQMLTGRRWQEKLDDITKTYVDADKTARELVGDRSKNVFARFANSTARDIQNRFNGGVSFDMYDRHAVERLLTQNPQMLPEWKINEAKDYRWNAKRVQNAVVQGIIQGEGIPQLTKRLTSELSAANAKHMTLFARTAMTGAQNAGRMERLHEAQDMGIRVRKKWMATLDGRTRDIHAELDGQEQDIDMPFKSRLGDIMYPGDPTADPANIYNCRCTLTYVYPRYDKSEWAGERRDQENDENIQSVSYSQRKAQQEREAGVIRGQFDVTSEYLSNAKPGEGKITYDPGYKFDNTHKREPEIAEWLRDTFGGDIQLLQEIALSENKPYRDYIWRGRDWELKSPNINKQNISRGSLQKAIKQVSRNPGGIILDFRSDFVDLEGVLKSTDDIFGRCGFDVDLIILNNQKLICVKRYKK